MLYFSSEVKIKGPKSGAQKSGAQKFFPALGALVMLSVETPLDWEVF